MENQTGVRSSSPLNLIALLLAVAAVLLALFFRGDEKKMLPRRNQLANLAVTVSYRDSAASRRALEKSLTSNLSRQLGMNPQTLMSTSGGSSAAVEEENDGRLVIDLVEFDGNGVLNDVGQRKPLPCRPPVYVCPTADAEFQNVTAGQYLLVIIEEWPGGKRFYLKTDNTVTESPTLEDGVRIIEVGKDQQVTVTIEKQN